MTITEAAPQTPTKRCPRCRQRRDPSWFSRDWHRPDGRACWCKPCSRRAWRERAWGITEEEFGRIMQAQGGGCAICGVRLAAGDSGKGPSGTFPSIRIDRTSDGRIRGFLCEGCSAGLRDLDADVDRLRAAVAYLAG